MLPTPVSVDNGMILLAIFHVTGRAVATAGPNLSARQLRPPNPRAAGATMKPR